MLPGYQLRFGSWFYTMSTFALALAVLTLAQVKQRKQVMKCILPATFFFFCSIEPWNSTWPNDRTVT